MRSFVLFIFVVPCFAQLADRSVRQLPHRTSAPSNIRIDVNMTLVPVTVLDTYGRTVTGLEADNFRVYDGAKEVPIVSFARQDQPISVGLIYDCSRSMSSKFKTARAAPHALFNELNADDESFLITVSDKAELRRGLTSNFNEIENALLFTHPMGTTSLIDGIYMGLQLIKKSHNPRRALIVVSDGGDNNSRYTLRELESLAIESDTQVFSMGLYINPQTQEEVDGPELLAALSQRTGGISFKIDDLNNLRASMAKVGVSLHHQYLIGYYVPGEAESGKYRRIKVQLMMPGGSAPVTLHARAGYFVPNR